jgi:hypothetical protein
MNKQIKINNTQELEVFLGKQLHLISTSDIPMIKEKWDNTKVSIIKSDTEPKRCLVYNKLNDPTEIRKKSIKSEKLLGTLKEKEINEVKREYKNKLELEIVRIKTKERRSIAGIQIQLEKDIKNATFCVLSPTYPIIIQK